MYNIHKLFRNYGNQTSFLNNLNISDNDKALLSSARKKIRAHLRHGITQITSQQLGAAYKVIPKFFTQGSWAYKTLNNPATFPPQEIDLDDGVYLPMSLITEASPTVACDTYFNIVDELLAKLIEENIGWELITNKTTCCRVKINERSHIDLPLYAIPDGEFTRLTEAAKSRGYESITEAALYDDSYTWLKLSSDKVWLATRNGEWEQSDPRKVDEWFKSQVAIFGEQFVHVCRYLKAWRDYHWTTGGPSSILLMVCASKGFEKHNARDDLAMIDVSKRLIDQLANNVDSPFSDIQTPLNMLDTNERKVASTNAQKLYASITTAIKNSENKNTSIRLITEVFGSRIPNDESLIINSTPADIVRSHPKKVVPAPAIAKVKAG